MPFKKPNPLYSVWQGMLNRCRNPKHKQWKDYGGRGIKVCERWKESFNNFVSDMGEKPLGFSLDRINNEEDYEPSNCKWSSKSEQQLNRRVTRKVAINGVEYIAAELAKKYGLKTDTIIQRSALGLGFDEVVSSSRRVFREGLALGGKHNGMRQRLKTHCPKGHPYNDANTIITPEGWRNCKECKLIKQRRINARNRLKKLQPAT